MEKYSVLNEIRKICGKQELELFDSKSEYRAIIKGEQSQLEAYYFGCPIYKQNSYALIDLSVKEENGEFAFYGYDSYFTVENVYSESAVRISNGSLDVKLKDKNVKNTSVSGIKIEKHNHVGQLRECAEYQGVYGEGTVLNIFPTFNGAAFEVSLPKTYDGLRLEFAIESDVFINCEKSTKRAALLKKNEFLPSMTICPWYIKDSSNGTFRLLEVQATATGPFSANIALIIPQDALQNDSVAVFTLDIYANKSILDTFAEEKNPEENNAYSQVGVLGETPETGKSYIFSRVEPGKFADLLEFSVEDANLYLPVLLGGNCAIEASKLDMPWCTFRTRWTEMVPPGKTKLPVSIGKSHVGVDVTSMLSEQMFKGYKASNGILLIGVDSDKPFILSMSDNYYIPAILQLTLEN